MNTIPIKGSIKATKPNFEIGSTQDKSSCCIVRLQFELVNGGRGVLMCKALCFGDGTNNYMQWDT